MRQSFTWGHDFSNGTYRNFLTVIPPSSRLCALRGPLHDEESSEPIQTFRIADKHRRRDGIPRSKGYEGVLWSSVRLRSWRTPTTGEAVHDPFSVSCSPTFLLQLRLNSNSEESDPRQGDSLPVSGFVHKIFYGHVTGKVPIGNFSTSGKDKG